MWFKENPQEWQDVKAEIQEVLDIYERRLKSRTSTERDFNAGACTVIEEIMKMEDYFINLGKDKDGEKT